MLLVERSLLLRKEDRFACSERGGGSQQRPPLLGCAVRLEEEGPQLGRHRAQPLEFLAVGPIERLEYQRTHRQEVGQRSQAIGPLPLERKFRDRRQGLIAPGDRDAAMNLLGRCRRDDVSVGIYLDDVAGPDPQEQADLLPRNLLVAGRLDRARVDELIEERVEFSVVGFSFKPHGRCARSCFFVLRFVAFWRAEAANMLKQPRAMLTRQAAQALEQEIFAGASSRRTASPRLARAGDDELIRAPCSCIWSQIDHH